MALDLSVYLSAIIGFLTALYFYLTWNYGFFKKMGIPGPRPWPLFGNAYMYFKKPLQEADTYYYRTYGRLFGTFEGTKPLLFVGDLDLARIIMQKEFSRFVDRRTFDLSKVAPVMNKTLTNLKGDEWRATRSVLSPSFTTTRMKQMLPILIGCANQFVSNCLEYAEQGKVLEFKPLFSGITMNVIASCGFGMQVETVKNPDHPFAVNARELTGGKPKIFAFVVFMIWPKLIEYFKIPLINEKPLKFFADACTEVMKIRTKESADNMRRKDFLQLMLDARKDDNIEPNTEEDQESAAEQRSQYSAKKVLDDEMILAQSLQLLLAGFETTASTLAFTAYCLATNPDVQDKLINEIDQVLGDKDITYEALAEAQMPYLDQVISETLRIYPPAGRTERVSTEKFVYDNLTIPVGTTIAFPIHGIHHDPEYYPEPDKFDPERFSPEMKASRHQFTFLPFGMGPRNCIGMRFALMEVKVVIVQILKTFKFITCSETKIPLAMDSINIVEAQQGIKLKLEKRY